MIKRIGILSLLLIGMVSCTSNKNSEILIPQSQRVPATEISANFINSAPLDLAQLKGKVVVVDFWATWCGPCRMEIPSLVSLYPVYHPKGLEILGLSIENPESEPKQYFEKFIKDFGINYPIGFASPNTVSNYGIEAIPATFFIDKTGKVAMALVGVHSQAQIEEIIEKLLAE